MDKIKNKSELESINLRSKGSSDIGFAIIFSIMLIIVIMVIYYSAPAFFDIFNSLKDVMGGFKALVFTLALVVSIILAFFGTLRR